MIDKLIILITLIFSISLFMSAISHYRKSSYRLIYFTLSILSLFLIIFTVFFPNWIFNNSNNAEHTNPVEKEIIEDSNQNNDTDPIKEQPKEKSPKEEAPINSKPPKSETVYVPENKIIEYKVVSGDTIWSIAIRSKKTVEKIKEWNNLSSDIIYVGQKLKIYGINVEPLPPNNPPSQVTPPTPTNPSSVLVTNGNLQEKEIALTFDAGSDAIGIGILDVLKKHNVKATFFLTGSWTVKYPSYAKRIANDGHEIGNHTYSHPDAIKTSPDIFQQDLLDAEEAITRVTGIIPRPYFRFPYGSYNDEALKTVGEAGYPFCIQWSLDTIDWKQPSVEVIVSRIEDGASNGDIILMHIGGINTTEAIEKVIPNLKAMGFKLVTLTEILN